MVESLLPIVNDPNSPEGRDDLNLFDLDPSVTLEPFRLLPGDDASCLNLYEPRSPRIIAPRDSFVAAGRSLGSGDGATTLLFSHGVLFLLFPIPEFRPGFQ